MLGPFVRYLSTIPTEKRLKTGNLNWENYDGNCDKKEGGNFTSRQCLKCFPKYVSYDWVYVYIERGALKRYRSPLRCSNGFYSKLYAEQKTSNLGSWSCNFFIVRRCSTIAESRGTECLDVNGSLFRIARSTLCLTLTSKLWLVRPIYVELHQHLNL